MSDIPGDLPASEPSAPGSASLTALAFLFLRLGLTAFGGPAAHIAMMQDEVVMRRKWLTQEEFLDLLGAANLIPGPSSTELAIYIGFRMAGWQGLLLAGTCFILPAFVLVMAIAWSYVRFGHLPQASGILSGVKPVVIAIVLLALWNLRETAFKSRFLVAIGIIGTALAFCAANPLFILFGAGLLMAGKQWFAEKQKESVRPLLIVLVLIVILVGVPLLFRRLAGGDSTLGLGPIFLAFLKLGSVIYGSGYVLLAFLRSDLVTQRGWLTSAQLLDSVAVGQITPGPVFTTATFIGFLLAGPKGAIVATLGIFLPAFLFVGVSGRLVSRLRQSATTSAFLDGVNAAALALMASVTWDLGRAALVNGMTTGIALVSFVLLLRFRVNSFWLVLGGAVVGFAASAVRATG